MTIRPFQKKDFQDCEECKAPVGTACRKPSCPQLKPVMFPSILGMPEFIRAYAIGRGDDSRRIPLHNNHTIRELFDGWYISYPAVKTLAGSKILEQRPVLGNKYTGDRYYIELPKIR